MPVMTEPVHAGEFIVSEGNNSISRELIELAPDLTLLPGTVLGKDTSTAVYAALDPAASNGLQMAAGILWDHVSTDATGWRSGNYCPAGRSSSGPSGLARGHHR